MRKATFIELAAVGRTSSSVAASSTLFTASLLASLTLKCRKILFWIFLKCAQTFTVTSPDYCARKKSQKHYEKTSCEEIYVLLEKKTKFVTLLNFLNYQLR
jgi:hypothetical protein